MQAQLVFGVIVGMVFALGVSSKEIPFVSSQQGKSIRIEAHNQKPVIRWYNNNRATADVQIALPEWPHLVGQSAESGMALLQWSQFREVSGTPGQGPYIGEKNRLMLYNNGRLVLNKDHVLRASLAEKGQAVWVTRRTGDRVWLQTFDSNGVMLGERETDAEAYFRWSQSGDVLFRIDKLPAPLEFFNERLELVGTMTLGREMADGRVNAKSGPADIVAVDRNRFYVINAIGGISAYQNGEQVWRAGALRPKPMNRYHTWYTQLSLSPDGRYVIARFPGAQDVYDQEGVKLLTVNTLDDIDNSLQQLGLSAKQRSVLERNTNAMLLWDENSDLYLVSFGHRKSPQREVYKIELPADRKRPARVLVPRKPDVADSLHDLSASLTESRVAFGRAPASAPLGGQQKVDQYGDWVPLDTSVHH